MDPFLEYKQAMTRRHFFGRQACGLGAVVLGACMNPSIFAGDLAAAGGASSANGVGRVAWGRRG